MLKNIIQEAKLYLHHIRKYVWFSLFVFLLAILGGWGFAWQFPDETAQYLEELKGFFESISQPSAFQTFLAIFQNNVNVMLTIVALGIFAGFFPLVFLLTNGFIIGVFAYLFASKGSVLLFFSGIAAHGIIEIPCLLFSAAIGLRVGKAALYKLFLRKENLTEELARGLKFAVTVIVPLLLVAALIETYITPLFISLAQFMLGADTSLLF